MRRTVVIGAAALFAAAACEDPATLEVRVTIEEADLSALTVIVDGPDGAAIDCQLPFDGAPEGLCPFEAGEGRWKDPEQFGFLLYGDPNRSVQIAMEGLRDGRSVTATKAQSSLPSTAGERRRLDLALVGRTRQRYRCKAQLPEGLPPAERSLNEVNQSDMVALSLAPSDRGLAAQTQQIVVSSRNLLAVVAYRKAGEDGCALEVLPVIDSRLAEVDTPEPEDPRRWCNVREGGLAARRAGAGAIVAAVCANGMVARLKAALVYPGRANLIREIELEGAPSRVSSPVLADTDGDGELELVVIYRRPDDGFDLRRYWSGNGGLQEARVELPSLMTPPSSLLLWRPLVLPPRTPSGAQTLIIAGYRGPTFFYEQGRLRSVRQTMPSIRPPAAHMLAPDRVGIVTAPTGARLAHSIYNWGGTTWSAGDAQIADLPASIDPSPSARIALGGFEAQDALRAVMFQDGVAYMVGLDERMPVSTIDVFEGAVPNDQMALWASIDGALGSELFAFDAEASRLMARRADGTSPDGWPLSFEGGGARRRILLTDLDGPPTGDPDGLRDMEVVSLVDRVLEVSTLGPGSHDPDDLDWPSRARDAARSGVHPGR